MSNTCRIVVPFDGSDYYFHESVGDSPARFSPDPDGAALYPSASDAQLQISEILGSQRQHLAGFPACRPQVQRLDTTQLTPGG